MDVTMPDGRSIPSTHHATIMNKAQRTLTLREIFHEQRRLKQRSPAVTATQHEEEERKRKEEEEKKKQGGQQPGQPGQPGQQPGQGGQQKPGGGSQY